MKILLDMNLSPLWVPVLTQAGFETVHWSTVGRQNAPDSELMLWAKQNGYVVFTHDLDFGDILAATNADAPSVIQVRTQNLHPEFLGAAVVRILNQFREQLLSGALIVIDEQKTRARILPIRR
jgi:predicted nuclease of predicted toxin-antitoxin system